MVEHTTRRRWIKLWTQETLYGTTKTELEPDERGVWFLMLCLAGDSVLPGYICISQHIPYTDDQLSKLFNITLELYQRTENKLKEHGKISKNGDGIIEIVNFLKYQGDFDRSTYMQEYMRDYRAGIRKTNSKTNAINSNGCYTNGKTSDKTRTEEDIDNVTNNNTTLLINNKYIYKEEFANLAAFMGVLVKLTGFYENDESCERLHKIITDYPKLNHNLEISKFVDWHLDKKKELKKPFVALRNWFDNALKYQLKDNKETKSHIPSVKSYTTAEEAKKEDEIRWSK